MNIGKFNIDLDKKQIILIGGLLGVTIMFFLFVGPLWSKVSIVSKESRALNDELSGVREYLKKGKHLNNKERRLLSRGEVSLAINEIMEAGASLDVDFFSTSPQQIQMIQGSKFPVLPIRMELQSTYEHFGMLLGALENLNKSIVTVKEFNIQRNPIVLPEIKVELVVDVHLKEGEGG